MTYTPKNILVTGGAGFIGCNYIHYLLNKYPECFIVNVDALTYAGHRQYLPDSKRHCFMHGNICDRELMLHLLRHYHIDTVVHFAAESHVDRSITGPAAFIETNIVGTFTLLEAVRTVWLEETEWGQHQCRFHHISTDEVYGTLDETAPAFTEQTPFAPNSPYSASKAGSDHLVRAYYHTYGLPITTTNCSNNYGPYQHNEKFIPTVIRACLTRTAIPVYGDGSNIRDWLYVEDHCHAIDRVVSEGVLGETYNIGGKCECSNIDLVKKIIKIMDVRFPKHAPHDDLLTFVKDRPGHDWRYAINCEKIEQTMGWAPIMSIDEGLARTIDFYVKQNEGQVVT